MQRSDPNDAIKLPGDKSITHRALFLRAIWAVQNKELGKQVGEDLYHGLVNASQGADCVTSETCLKQLLQNYFEKNNTNHNQVIYKLLCENSGTTARLIPSLIRRKTEIHGDESLTKRPMSRVFRWFAKTSVRYLKKEGFLPVELTPQEPTPLNWQVDVASAQVKTLWFFLALQRPGSHTLQITSGSRTHTETMLKKLGVRFRWESQETMDHYQVDGPAQLKLCSGSVPSDPSALSFWVLACALSETDSPLEVSGLSGDPHRLAYLKSLSLAGFPVELSPSQEKGFIDDAVDCKVCLPKKWGGFNLDAMACAGSIDELPVMVILAAMGEGVSVFGNVSELRFKESNRLEWVKKLLTGLKVKFKEANVANSLRFEVEGVGRRFFKENLKNLLRGVIAHHSDHRLAMIACILAKFGSEKTSVQNTECIDVSYPDFLQQLNGWSEKL